MVNVGEFEVQLVEAESKTPFKEFEKDGKIYVEVEPDVEYFVAIRKTQKSEDCKKVQVFVDGKDLDYKITYKAKTISSGWSYRGIRSHENGVSTHRALKLVKPKFTANNAGNANLLMGSVELKIFRAESTGQVVRQRGSRHTFEAAPISISSSGKKKNLRSEEGSTAISKTKPSQFKKMKSKELLETITLNYCSALGLIEAGVLPKPGLWQQSAKRPAPKSEKPLPVPKKMRDVANNNKKVEVFDLCQSDEEN